MEAGETNLLREVQQQHFAGRDWEKIRFLFTSLVNCVKNLHDCDYIHGDLKPMNILLTRKGETKLIDFDAACSLKDGHYVGSKYSSSYLPPEMFYENEGKVGVRTYEKDWLTGLPQADQNLPYSLVAAHISHDIWSLGVILYYLCIGGPLILSTADDNIVDRNDMLVLLNWTNETLIKKLSNTEIPNRYARNFVSMLLTRDPEKRPNCDRILLHPFITGKEAQRLPGEEPDWDVFISYRVKSDSDHAQLLYESLTSAGLKVWWDVKCLEPGENWEKGFCEGLMSSECLLCLLSREAINSSSDRALNISNLHHDSPPDNVLLEWRLGKELQERGMISKIYPVLIGDKISGEGEDTIYSDYFKSGCHPRGLEDVVIDSIENKCCNHLNNGGLGLPYQKDLGVKTMVDSITSNQGGFLRGVKEDAIKEIVITVIKMIQNSKKISRYSSLVSQSETEK